MKKFKYGIFVGCCTLYERSCAEILDKVFSCAMHRMLCTLFNKVYKSAEYKILGADMYLIFFKYIRKRKERLPELKFIIEISRIIQPFRNWKIYVYKFDWFIGYRRTYCMIVFSSCTNWQIYVYRFDCSIQSRSSRKISTI